MQYGYKRRVMIPYQEAIDRTREELNKEGFGVLTEIDVKATLKKKLNVDYDNYIILGACNPQFAYQALKAEKDIGLLLPCNIIIYDTNGQTLVSAIKPTVAMNMVENEALRITATQVEEKLEKVIDSIYGIEKIPDLRSKTNPLHQLNKRSYKHGVIQCLCVFGRNFVSRLARFSAHRGLIIPQGFLGFLPS
jgi:uncharacterized protein (DUF302 family)